MRPGGHDRDPLETVLGADGAVTPVAHEIAARFELGRVRRVEPLARGAGRRNAAIETDTGSWVLRVGIPPANLSSGSHELSNGLDVLRRERFFATAVGTRTRLAAPCPYQIDAVGDLLPQPYAVMPRLPGTVLWWSEDRDWEAVGVALAEAALELHRPEWPAAGSWDPTTDDIAPLDGDPASRCRARVAALVDRIAITSEALDADSRRWVEDQLAPLGSGTPDRSTLVHGDLVIGNVCMAQRDTRWSVTGVFDFENARIGDPEEDLVGHLWWAQHGGRPEASAPFLRRYHEERPVSERVYPYLVASLLDNWEYGRRNQEPWYGSNRTFGEWARPLHARIEQAMRSLRG